MATEPVSSGIAAGLVVKLGIAGFIGVIGGAIMAMFDPTQSRKELFLQAAAAGTGSIVFGPLALLAATKYLPFDKGDLMVPVYFLVGAVSWGVFAALAKFRKLVAEKGAQKAAEKVGL